MSSKLPITKPKKISSVQLQSDRTWLPFQEILRRLHTEGIYIHSEQLAEFFLTHGLPVDLCYVPTNLKKKAIFINENYRGDMAHLSKDADEQPGWDSTWL